MNPRHQDRGEDFLWAYGLHWGPPYNLGVDLLDDLCSTRHSLGTLFWRKEVRQNGHKRLEFVANLAHFGGNYLRFDLGGTLDQHTYSHLFHFRNLCSKGHHHSDLNRATIVSSFFSPYFDLGCFCFVKKEEVFRFDFSILKVSCCR